MQPRIRVRGFSLIEVLVTIAVLAIIVSVGLPSFLDMLGKQRLKGAAEAIYSDLQLTRMEAIKRNTNVFLSFQGSGTEAWCYAMSAGAACDCTTAGSCQVEAGVNSRVVDGGNFDGVTLTENFTADATLFNPDRGTTNRSGTVRVSLADGRSIDVVLTTLGRVRICSSTVPGYPICP